MGKPLYTPKTIPFDETNPQNWYRQDYVGYFHSCPTDIEARAYAAKDRVMEELKLFKFSYRVLNPRLVHWNTAFCKLFKDWPEDIYQLFKFTIYYEYYHVLERLKLDIRQRTAFAPWGDFLVYKRHTLSFVVLYYKQAFPGKVIDSSVWSKLSRKMLEFQAGDFECLVCTDIADFVSSSKEFFAVDHPMFGTPYQCECVTNLMQWVTYCIEQLYAG